MPIQRTQDDSYYYARKPHGIPSTFGAQHSFVEYIQKEKPAFFAPLAQHFSAQEEYWLLNRLDNDTAGYLYFAKDKKIFDAYKTQQDAHQIYKLYLCDVQGQVDVERTVGKHPELLISNNDEMTEWQNDATLSTIIPSLYHSIICAQLPWAQEQFDNKIRKGLTINYPIMHHAQHHDRMVAIRIPKDQHKWRGNQHMVETTLFPLSYDSDENTTTCLVRIYQWIRHQIRVHAASVWYPIVWDPLYAKSGGDEDLHLWSIGLQFKKW